MKYWMIESYIIPVYKIIYMYKIKKAKKFDHI